MNDLENSSSNKRTSLDENNSTSNKKQKIEIENNIEIIVFPPSDKFHSANQFYIKRFEPIQPTELYHVYEDESCIGWTDLMKYTVIATNKGLKKYLKTLVNKNEEINKQNQLGYSALLLAASYSYTNKCLILLQNGADLKQTTNIKENVLTLCVQIDDSEKIRKIIKTLVEYSISQKINILEDIQYKHNYIEDNLLRDLLFYEPFNYEIVKLIFKNMESEKAKWYANEELIYFCLNSTTVLHYVNVTEMNISILEILFEFGAKINNVISLIYYIQNPKVRANTLIVVCKALENIQDRYKKELYENEIMKEALLASPVNGIVGHILGYVNCSN